MASSGAMSLVIMPSLVALSGGAPWCRSTPSQRAIERIGAGDAFCGQASADQHHRNADAGRRARAREDHVGAHGVGRAKGAGLSERVRGCEGRAGAEAAVGPVLRGDQQLDIDSIAEALIPSVLNGFQHVLAVGTTLSRSTG